MTLDAILSRFPALEGLSAKNVLNRLGDYIGDRQLKEVLYLWSRPERHYHNLTHLKNILNLIAQKIGVLSDKEIDILVLAAVYHDAVYDPKSTVNEENSVLFLKSHFIVDDIGSEDFDTACNIILCTKTHQYKTELEKLFVSYDLAGLGSSNLQDLIKNEENILREYQYVPYQIYRTAHTTNLTRLREVVLELYPDSAIDQLITHIANRKLRIGVYAGTFFPIHMGHYDIVKKGERIFDKVMIAVGKNTEKVGHSFIEDYEERLRSILPFHEIAYFKGALTDFVNEQKSDFVDLTFIRGLRNSSDFEMEKNQLRYIEEMDPSINTVFIMADKSVEHVSSTGCRALKQLNSPVFEKYVPGEWPDIELKYRNR